MTKRGGESAGRRIRVTLAAALMLASTFVAPLSVYADSSLITQLGVSSPTRVDQSVASSEIVVQTRSAEGVAESLSTAGQLHVSSSSATGQFYAAATDDVVTILDIAADNSQQAVRYIDNVPGTYTLTFRIEGGGLTEPIVATQQIIVVDTVTPVDTTKLVFTRTDAYRARTTQQRLQTDTRATEVRFFAGGSEIAAQQVASDSTEYALWHPVANPAGGSALTAQVLVNGSWYDAHNSVTLHDTPTVSLPSYGVRGGSEFVATGTVHDSLASTVVIRLVRVSDGAVIANQTVGARGSGVELARFALAGVATGDYRVELTATDSAGELARAESPVSINTTVPRVLSITAGGATLYAGRSFTISGTTSAPAGSSAQLEYGDQLVPVGLGASDEFTYTFSGGLPVGSYQFALLLTDALGNTNRTSLQPSETLALTIVAAPVVSPVRTDYIVPLAIEPVRSLSTEFELPVSSSLIKTTKRSSVFGAVQPATDVDDEQSRLEKIVDLRAEEPPATPLAPTSGGWSLFGLAWYWWVAGAGAAWLSGAGLYRWLRKA